jgi:hypothetical protein
VEELSQLLCLVFRYGALSSENLWCSHGADIKDGMEKILDRVEIPSENTFFGRIASEQLVGRKKPVLAVRKGIANLTAQRFSIVVYQVSGRHYLKNT